jgi:hypothetical protein
MANMYRKQKVTDHANERRFSFVAQIPAPEGGFASILDAIKAWHCYNTSMPRPERGQRPGEHERAAPQASPQDDTARQCRDDIRGRRAPVAVRRKRG